jgi:hypothetical protein
MRRKPISHSLGIVSAVLVIALGGIGIFAPALLHGSETGVSFSRDIQPMLDQKCVSCHPSVYPYLDLRTGRSYAQLVGVSPPNAPSYERVVAGQPRLSYLLLHPADPSRKGLLTKADRRLIIRWILEGAKNN